MSIYTCICCDKSFEAKHKTALCPECKLTPLVCAVCGKEFPRKYFPYDQKTCSSKCRGIYRAQSGIAKAGAAKMLKTKLDKYGTLDPSLVANANGTVLAKKICPLCGKEFQPRTGRQIYCEDKHYGPCPVCGKLTEILDPIVGPTACSEECRMARIYATNIERYGNKDAVNSEHAKKLAKQHNMEKYGVEHYSQTEEFKQRYKQTNLEKYGVEAPLQSDVFKEKAKQTNLEKYGKEFYLQTEEGKAKIKDTLETKYGGVGMASPTLSEQIKETNRKRYGVDYLFESKEIQQKMHENSIKKNGTLWPAMAPEVVEKRNNTNIERYGCKNPWGNKDIQDKIKRLWVEKYGGPNPMYDPEMAKLTSERQQQAMINKYGANASVRVPEIKDKIIATNMERYGVPWYWLKEDLICNNISEHNIKFSKWINNIGLTCTLEFLIEDRPFDLKIDNTNIVIEIDPTVTHNAITDPWHSVKKENKEYHLQKSQVAEKHGYRCIHVFDWDNFLCIVSMLKPKTRIYARQCKLEKIDKRTAEIFTEKYHIQGKCRGQNIVYGLYYDGELVEMMSFGKPRYNKNYDFELLRLCTKHGLEIVGGASKLFKKFKKVYPESSVISYCDCAKFTGSVYDKIGMTFKQMTPPAKVWSKGSEYITDNYLRSRGYDQLFGTSYGKGTSNEQLMLENGWLPVYDCGQKVFEYIPKNLSNNY